MGELAEINKLRLPDISQDLGAAMGEEMDGLTLEFDRVKIPSGGGLAFEVPGDDPDNPDTAKEIIGIMVDHHPVNAYWKDKFSGGNNPPDCSSMDGKIGIDQEGCKTACADCLHNQWGSDEETGGKACKNMHRVYILPDGEALPLLVTTPPTSLKNLSNYLAKRIVTKGLRSHGVVTKMTLKKTKNKTGIDYSQVQFAKIGTLTPEQTGHMAAYAEGIKAITRNLEIGQSDYEAAVTTDEASDEEMF
jgi:hypothetical protein